MVEIVFPFPMLAGHLAWSTEHRLTLNGERLSMGGGREVGDKTASVKWPRQSLERAGSVGKDKSRGRFCRDGVAT